MQQELSSWGAEVALKNAQISELTATIQSLNATMRSGGSERDALIARMEKAEALVKVAQGKLGDALADRAEVVRKLELRDQDFSVCFCLDVIVPHIEIIE